MWGNVCYLGIENQTTNDIGDLVSNITYGKEVFCDEKSIKASEFYQAQAVGMKPEVTLEIMLVDYEKEKYVIYENEEYTILRTYKKSPEKIELTLVRGINNGDS